MPAPSKASRFLGADLADAQLQGADLSRAQLQGADLSEAQLQVANLDRAHLQGADLIEAHLQGADLSEAQLQAADLKRAQTRAAFIHRTCKLHSRGYEGSRLSYGLTDEERSIICGKSWSFRPVGTAPPDEDWMNAASYRIDRERRMLELRNGATAPSWRDEPSGGFDFEASGEKPVLVSAPPEPALATHPDWLITEPTAAYTEALVGYLASDLASTDPSIAAGIADRILSTPILLVSPLRADY